MSNYSESVKYKSRRALIVGAGGQDAAYLSKFLLSKSYEVIGTSRDVLASNYSGLNSLGLSGLIKLESMAPSDFRSVLTTIKKYLPDEIYNLAGQSSVGLSFEQPVETMESIVTPTLNILESIKFVDHPIRFYNAGSSECFGDTKSEKANENTAFHPRSPYAVAKACAHNLVANYRDAYGMHASTGMLFNHESPIRPERFVTQKIILSAVRTFYGSNEKVKLGNIDIHRDWGWAPEYVEVMWRMLQEDGPEDLVIATGRTESLRYFIRRVYEFFDLNWQHWVEFDKSMLRPSDIIFGAGDPARAREKIGWIAVNDVDKVIDMLCTSAKNRFNPHRHNQQ